MPFLPPSLVELREQVISSIESNTGQSIPSYEKAWNRIVANAIALVTYPVYKFISWNYRQALVSTSDENHLENYHGIDENIQREYATKAEFDAELTVTSPAVISISTTFENEATGLFYFPKQEKSVTVSDDKVTLIADGFGAEYSVDIGDTLKISGSQIEGVLETCTVDSIAIYGSDKQDLEDYRADILLSKSGVTGGSTISDYRKWGQAVSGVYRVFPFSGRPHNPTESLPGDRSIFVESDHDLGTDGIPTSDILDAVRDEIEIDPETGLARECLGLTDSTLYVESVHHVDFSIAIYDLTANMSIEAELKESIEDSADEYFKSLSSYVYGLDPEYERVDNVSSITVSGLVNDLLKQYSAYASNVVITEDSVGVVTNRLLIGGDLARLSTVSYVSS